ncbi:MAG: thioredoxin-dependent thiol peroxidase [Cyanobacteria bacterium P01_A01_bin.3]
MTLSIGDPAPDFTLPDGQGNSVTLSKLKGQTVVLYFYPRDNTPGCTKEACNFRDNYSKFTDANIAVYGISADSAKSHQKFTDKYDLPFPLLSDEENQVTTAYDAYGLKKFMGKEYMGIIRSTVVIAPDGTIAQIYKKVKTATHAEDILPDLINLQT